MVDRKYELGHEPVGRLLLRYSTPAMLAMFVTSTYNIVDTIFVGRGVGTLALAGLAVSFPIQMCVLALAQLVGLGAASIISRRLGAGDQDTADRTAGTSFAIVTALSLLFTLGGIVFLRPLLRLFGATDAVLPYAVDYLFIVLLGSVFFAFAVSSNNIVRSEGNAKVAMTSMLIGAGLNIVLDPIFIFKLGLGVRGAALATVISHVASGLFLCAYFLSGKSLLHFRCQHLKPDLGILPEMLAIGSPSLARMAAGNLLAIVLNNSVTHYGGDVHLAFIGVANRVLMLTLMPIFGLVQGLQPIVGFNYGAQQAPRVKQALHKASRLATLIAGTGFVVLMIAPGSILRVFSEDPLLISEGRTILRIVIIMLPTVGFQVVGASFFQAIGKARPALFLSMSRQVLFLLPLMLLLPLEFGLAGVWAAIPAADFFAAAVTALWLAAEVRRIAFPPVSHRTQKVG